ncbi:MAG: ABC transporter ATP-binding protein [Gammaproteobacteria bacterium]|nr:ABC transporter ATP-binding protein [Gammaproteobacteria bacterium]
MTGQAKQAPRDHSMFDADLSGEILNMRLLQRLWAWLKPYRTTLLLSAALVLLASFFAVLMPIVFTVVVIDHIILGTQETPSLGMVAVQEWVSSALDFSPIAAACVIYGVLQLAWALLRHQHTLTLTSAVLNGLRDLRRDLFKHLLTRPSSFYDRVAVGRVMTRVTNDIEALFESFRGLGSLVGEFVPFIVALAIIVSIDIKLSVLLLCILPLVGLVTALFRKASRELFRQVRQSVSTLNQNLQENLAGLGVVQLSGRETANLARYQGVNEENLAAETRSMRIETLYHAFIDSLTAAAVGIVVWYGGGAVIQEQISLGALILFTRYLDMLFYPIVMLGEQTNLLFRAMASGERIFQALDWNERIHEPSHPVALTERLAGDVEFRHLDFAYEPGNPVLHNVSFSIAAGESLAIVGPTGSGKSTLIRLLARFYDFDDGRIFLDGIDINQIHTRDLRTRIGVVLQDFHVFAGSIHHNIALSNPKISREQAIEAARKVGADAFIRELPKGYDTELSERGRNLSQGQRQLLAFARVLAADPEILVLDEATANIDTQTEGLIQTALREITKDRTSIIIAHRLQTIQEANRVLVLHHGRVEEIGSHEALLEQDGLYATLHKLQFVDQETDPEVIERAVSRHGQA